MKLFLDTADIDEIRRGAAFGILDGVTTNPTLVAKQGKNFRDVITEIAGVVNGPVSAEVTSLRRDDMIDEARTYAKWHDHVVVKLPTTRDGVAACRILSDEGIRINMTLCFSPAQALLIGKAGAFFCSPFVGRLEDISEDGLKLIRDIVQIYRNYGVKTQILAASLRSPAHVVECAKAGADIATMPFKVLDALFDHPLTDKGLATFSADWKRMQASPDASAAAA